jgi:hypothetical protein
MAFELKRKDVVKESGYKLCAGYCDMQNLLHYQDRIGYPRGVHGWNCDVYRIGDVVLTTGYRGMVGSSINYDLLRDYELKAEKICYDYSLSYEERRDKVNTLLYELLDKAK